MSEASLMELLSSAVVWAVVERSRTRHDRMRWFLNGFLLGMAGSGVIFYWLASCR